jgi:hypothetical protein
MRVIFAAEASRGRPIPYDAKVRHLKILRNFYTLATPE